MGTITSGRKCDRDKPSFFLQKEEANRNTFRHKIWTPLDCKLKNKVITTELSAPVCSAIWMCHCPMANYKMLLKKRLIWCYIPGHASVVTPWRGDVTAIDIGMCVRWGAGPQKGVTKHTTAAKLTKLGVTSHTTAA